MEKYAFFSWVRRLNMVVSSSQIDPEIQLNPNQIQGETIFFLGWGAV